MRKSIILLFGLWGVLSALATPQVVVNDKTPSLFFANGPASPDFDYGGWTQNKTIYKHSFDAAKWDAFAPLPSAKDGNIELTRAQAEALLLRFQKPGGYDPRQHAHVMQAILESKIYNDSPELVSGALENVLATSSRQYDRFVAANPKLHQIPLKHNESRNPFRTEAEDKQVYRAALKYVDGQIDKLLPDNDPLRETKLSDWTNLRPLATIWWRMSEDERDGRETAIMESMAYAAAHDGTFPSIDVHINEGVINPIFDDPAVARTILDVIRRGDKLVPVILSTQPIDSERQAKKKNSYGYYAVKLDPIPVKEGDPKAHKEITWRTGGREFKSTIDYRPLDPKKAIISGNPAPNYKELWTAKGPDGKTVQGAKPTLSTLVLFGSTLSKDAPWVIRDSYNKYLRERGFKPGKTETITNVKEFVKQQIISGQTSVLDRETHSAGNIESILRVGKSGKVTTWIKTNDDGSKEVVRILSSDPKEATEDIPHWEFGRWIRARARIAHKQLLDLNLSCWSAYKARYEIPEAHSKTLEEIVSFTVADFFFDRKDNMMRILYDGIRAKKTYAQIRKDLKKDPDYVKKTADFIQFADQYRKKVVSDLPVQMEIKTKDDRGRLYWGDEFEPRPEVSITNCQEAESALASRKGAASAKK